VSRGDRSGTHVKELAIWDRAGRAPERPWYRESGQGMGATLVIASELVAYALTDVATFLGHKLPPALEILVEGDTILRNPYHVIRANPERFPRVNVEGATALSSYLLAPQTQRRIAEFRRAELGRSVFIPDGSDGRDGSGPGRDHLPSAPSPPSFPSTYPSTIPSGTLRSHAPRVKSGISTDWPRFRMERSLSSLTEDHAAPS
jgi:hypothetical protein